MNNNFQHDFVNNTLRIEIINKMLLEKLEQQESIDSEMITDLKRFLQDHINLLNTLQEWFHNFHNIFRINRF